MFCGLGDQFKLISKMTFRFWVQTLQVNYCGLSSASDIQNKQGRIITSEAHFFSCFFLQVPKGELMHLLQQGEWCTVSAPNIQLNCTSSCSFVSKFKSCSLHITCPSHSLSLNSSFDICNENLWFSHFPPSLFAFTLDFFSFVESFEIPQHPKKATETSYCTSHCPEMLLWNP